MFKTEYIKLINLNLLNFRPWKILSQDASDEYTMRIKERYPKRNLIPFAVRIDCDDIACWDLSKENKSKIYIIHDFATEGWEEQRIYDNFSNWLHDVVTLMLENDD